MNPLKTFVLLVWHAPLAIVSVIISVSLCMVACRELLLRLLAPAIFSILPKRYRRILYLA
jgi:hypothetical protein